MIRPLTLTKPCQIQLRDSESSASSAVACELAWPVFVGDVTARLPGWPGSGVVFDVGFFVNNDIGFYDTVWKPLKLHQTAFCSGELTALMTTYTQSRAVKLWSAMSTS